MTIRITGDIGSAVGLVGLEFSGCAAGFNVPFVSRAGTVLLVLRPGAFAETLANPRHRRRVRILLDHDPAKVIGTPLELQENERGLFVRARLLPSARAFDVSQRLLRGELAQLSIGFSYRESPSGHLRGLVLHEVSVVRAGANPLARIESATVSPYVPRVRCAEPGHWRALADDTRGDPCTPTTT
jgi:HK97 family phage prohead protease